MFTNVIVNLLIVNLNIVLHFLLMSMIDFIKVI
jgi:hypothetical protein